MCRFYLRQDVAVLSSVILSFLQVGPTGSAEAMVRGVEGSVIGCVGAGAAVPSTSATSGSAMPQVKVSVSATASRMLKGPVH